MKSRHAVFATVLSGVLALSLGVMPTMARAADSDELQTQVDEALATLQSYTQQLELANNQLYELNQNLESVKGEIEATESEISEKEQELEEGRAKLGDRLSETYKQGGSTGILSVILGTSSFDELVSTLFYADRMADYDSELLQQVMQTQQELEQKRSELEEERTQQEQLVADQQATTDQMQSQVSAQQAYYNSLDSELQAQLQAEAEARRQASLEAAAQAEASNNNDGGAQQQGGGQDSGSQGSNGGGQASGGQSSNSGGSSSGGGQASSGGNTNSGSSPSSVVSIARAQVGKGYVLGTAGPNTFDCSGLVTYCYGQLGYSLPHSSQALYNRVSSNGHLVTNSSYLSPGDLVFWGNGGSGSSIYHVAIYIGGGQVVHAANPYYGVVITGLFEWDSANYVGGGSPV